MDPATGNVYSTGSFTGTVTFGSTRLVSAGGNDVFVAKWDATAGAFTSAVRGGGINAGTGTGGDIGYGIAVASAGGTASVYVTGQFVSGTGASIAGTALAGTGTSTSTFDVFVARYTDAGTGLANGSAVSGGGTGNDIGYGIAAVSSGGTASVYVTGYFVSGTGASIAGTALAGTSSTDLFVARYTDAGTGLADGGAISGGGTGADVGNGIAAAGGAVYVGGYIVPAATFGSIGLG